MSIIWNTGAAAERHRLKLKKKKAASYKPQAASASKRTQLKSRIKT